MSWILCSRCTWEGPLRYFDVHSKSHQPWALGKIVSETKHLDEGKLGIHWILAMQGLDDVAAVGDYGATKYDQGNWRHGTSWMRLFGSTARHLIKAIRGQNLDEESKLPHLAHVVFDALILLEWMKTKKGTDDRPIINS